jgi:hypothetical protein
MKTRWGTLSPPVDLSKKKNLLCLFPKPRKKAKPPKMTQQWQSSAATMSQLLTEGGALSLESLKKELIEANTEWNKRRNARSYHGEVVAEELMTKLVSVEE